MYDESEVARRWFQTRKVYERAVLPIDKGGMALRNVRPVFFGYFACSLAASLKDLVKVFPDKFLYVVASRSPCTSYEVECVKEYRKAFPKGAFGDNNNISAILKTIAPLPINEMHKCRARLNSPQSVAFMMKLRQKKEGPCKALFMAT